MFCFEYTGISSFNITKIFLFIPRIDNGSMVSDEVLCHFEPVRVTNLLDRSLYKLNLEDIAARSDAPALDCLNRRAVSPRGTLHSGNAARWTRCQKVIPFRAVGVTRSNSLYLHRLGPGP